MRRSDPDDAVLVELDEGDEGPGAPTGDDGGTRGTGDPDHPRRRRALWWAGLGVIVALVAAVVLTNVAEARRDAARRAAFADLPWVLPALDGPMHEAWRVAGGWVMGETSAAILLSDVNGSGGVRGIDPQTGAVLWELPVAEGYCWPAPAMAATAGEEATPAPSLHDVVVCDRTSEPSDDGTVTSELSTYDGVTGGHLATLVTDGATVFTGMVGGDYLTASTLPDGTVVVALTDLRTGTARWTTRTGPDEAGRVFTDSWQMTYDDDVIYFDGPEDLVLSRATGAELAAKGPPPRQVELTLPDDGRVELQYDPSTNAVGGWVVDADGRSRFAFDGWPWSGFGFPDPAVLVVQRPDQVYPSPSSGTVVAGLDPSTGDELWRRPETGWSNPLLALDGLGIMVSRTDAVAFDMVTGAQRWTRPTDPVVFFNAPVTDGDLVLLADRANDVLELAAVDVRTGEDRWRMAAPSGLSAVGVSNEGLVLMSTTGELIAYRP